ncbi:hypothetical protein SAMN04488029_1061 [Reichenbachiella faecimaris]|uniref:Uncharacterized protein n=1 Tax=Reichenbachiella faecimaris TaxID=692418 RepID=A0A1W2G7Q2_REIFA|nr:hypothetical protein [Reichenbachiella faecimaris]SMD32710.1 hypothetical protein SAMN04488029_1061 [Reichenbachiella faecimaris]
MIQDKIVTHQITRQLSASVISTHPSTQLDQPLWAINWFDLKRAWLYDLYNKLVFNHVRKIGAFPVFKARLSKTILDNERLKRDMLLIVQYPQALSFLEMISSTLFQVKSLLRTSSVQHFQFGFMQKLNQESLKPSKLTYKGKLKYMVHICEEGHYKAIESLISHAASLEVFPHFIGQKSAILGLQKEKGKLKTLDFVLSHTLVFSGFDAEALEGLVNSGFYQEFIQSSKFNFIGIFDREI